MEKTLIRQLKARAFIQLFALKQCRERVTPLSDHILARIQEDLEKISESIKQLKKMSTDNASYLMDEILEIEALFDIEMAHNKGAHELEKTG